MTKIGYLLILALAVACTYNDTSMPTEYSDDPLAKTWLLYERGYSPGAGYITEAVPDKPAQYLTLRKDQTMNSNIAGLEKFMHYRVVDDPSSDNNILGFFEQDPGSDPVEVQQLQHSYNMTQIGSNIKLTFRYCFEGCHMSFRPLVSEEK